MTVGYQIQPEFRVVQHQRDEEVLEKLKSFFGFGSIHINHDDRKEFRVRGFENLAKIVQFFKENPLQTSKQKTFEIFSEILEMMNNKEHLTREGLEKITKLASKTNRKYKRCLESSETIRRSS